MIVEEEQHGNERADYGKQLIRTLSKKLTKDFGRGFSQRNLEQMRQFYVAYSKAQTVSAQSGEEQPIASQFQLSWSHYLKLMGIDDVQERKLYRGPTLLTFE